MSEKIKNIFDVKLDFPEGLEMTLKIGKSKKNKFSSLEYKNRRLKSIESNLLPEEYNDGDKITVYLKNGFITNENDEEIIAVGDSLIEINTVTVDVIRDGNKVNIAFGDIVLDTKDVDYFEELFIRSSNYNCPVINQYQARLISPTEISIERYSNNHQHSEYSALDGMSKLKQIANKVPDGSGCGLTDHYRMTGDRKFWTEMKEHNKIPVLGMEGAIERIDENILNDIYVDTTTDEYKKSHFLRDHIILLAKDNTGYHNLVKLASLSWNNFYGKNHITFKDLKQYSEGIIVTSACIGATVSKSILEDERRIRKIFFEELGIEDFQYIPKRENECDIIEDDDLNINAEEKQLLKNKFNIETDILTVDIIKDLIEKDSFLFSKTKEELKSYKSVAKMYINKMIEIFGREDFYIEIQRHNFVSEQYVEKRLLELAKEFNLKLTIGIDNHFVNKEDAPVHEMWLCEATKKTLTDTDRLKFPGDGYWFMSSEEVLERFGDLPEALDGSLEILNKCRDVDLTPNGYKLPKYPLPEGYEDTKEGQVAYFKKMVLDGYKNRFLGTDKYNDPVYTNRMSFEIKTILNMGFESYFLIVQDYISWAKDNNVAENIEKYFPKAHYNWDEIPEAIKNKTDEIFVGPGRGSAAGSLVAYCLGITNINPIEYDLLFERFLNPDRISMPDIDTDFEDSERERVIDYCKAKYGAENVSRIGTIGVLAAKGIIRSIQRIEGKEVALANKICKTIPNTPGITLAGALESSPEFKKMYDEEDEVKEMVDTAMKLEGLAKTTGIHACGILIAPDAVNNFIPQQILKNPKNGEKELTTQYTGPECEDSGLLKMDFLGLRTLGVLHEGINDINKVSENKINLTSIPINDMETMKFLSTGMTDGVFQFESSFMKDIVKKMLQDINSNKTLTGDICFNRLTDATALGRPGPMATIPDYVKNLLNPAQIKPTNTPLDEILKPTYGIIVYQEQVMNAVKALAGFSAGDADAVRKAMGKKLMDKMAILREMFIYGNKEKGIPGCIKNGYDEKWAIELWDRMAEFAKYAFNKSHAVAYTYLSLKTAWISKYYPNIFYKSNLNSFIDNNDKIKQYINVAKKRGVNVLGPDINLSGQAFSIDYENYNNMSPIRFGLKGIKTLGDSSKYIIQERELNGPFINLQDFVTRMISNYSIGKKSIEALIRAGALDSFEGTRKNKIDALDKLVNSCKAEANELKRGQLTIFQLAKEMNDTGILNQIEELNHIDYDLNDKYSLEEELKAEKEYTGFYISRHPIDEYKTYLASKDAVNIENIIKDKEEEEIVELVEENESSDEQLDQTTLDDILDLDSEVTIGGIIKDLEVHYSKKNNSKLKTFVIEDDTAEIKAVAFTKTLERNNIDNIISDDNVVICTGKVVKDDFGTQLIVSNISKIDDDKLSIPSTINVKIPSKIIGAKVRELISKHLDTKKSTRLVMWYSEDGKTFKSYTRYVKYSCSLIEGLTSIVGPKNIKTR
jgi:DNA polymerase-3 subunit alpha